ncbi:MAG: glycosyltransferase [Bacteroidales bacterium]|nr:glycosyltransferase [Bacteroidales bacterium]
MRELIDLSIIIVSYNVKYFLELCLNSVEKAAEDIPSEIIVIDNNSSDDSCSMVNTLFPTIRLIRNSYNEGFAKACNQGLRLAKGEFVLLLNPDTLIDENSLRCCINFMRSHPLAGAMGVKMLDGNGKYLRESKRAIPLPMTAFFKIAGLTSLFPHSTLFSRYYMEHIDNNKTAEIEVLPGAFMFIRKNILGITGLLDERFFMYGEDIDLSFRIIKAGYKIYYYPEVKIIHFKSESSRKSPINSTIHFYKAMLIFVEKHFKKKKTLPIYIIIKPAIYISSLISLLKKTLTLVAPSFSRFFSSLTELPLIKNIFLKLNVSIVVSKNDTYNRIIKLVEKSGMISKITGRVSISSEDNGKELLGIISQLHEIIKENKITEIIFSLSDSSPSQIIESISMLPKSGIKIKFVPAGEKFILYSKNVCTIK